MKLIALEKKDFKKIIELQTKIVRTLKDDEIFQSDDINIINRCINGISLGCFISSRLVAYLLIFNPLSIEESYSRFKDKSLPLNKIVHFETAIVDHDYRGQGLQYYMFKEAIDILKNRNFQYVYSLCSPENTPSIKNFHKLDMKDILCVRIFGDKRRVVFFKSLEQKYSGK